jgi:hypothetical protein
VSFIVFLLFGTYALAKKKPPAQPVNTNAATSEELQQVLRELVPPPRKEFFRCAKSYGPFRSVDVCCRVAGLGGSALKKYASISGPENKFQERFASSELFRPRKTQNAACKSICRNFTEASYPANRR